MLPPVGVIMKFTDTDAELGGQVPFEIVHVYTYEPASVAVAVDVPELALLNVDVPGPDV